MNSRSATRRTLAAVTATAVATLAALLAVTVTSAQGSPASSASASPGVTPPSPSKSPMPPAAPTGVTATVTSTSVTLSWTASKPGCCGVAGYNVTYAQAFDDVYRLAQAGNATSVTITAGIYPAQQYTFRVTAYDDANHSSLASEPVTVVTPRSDNGTDTVPPQAPSQLTVTAQTPAGPTLSWSPSTDDVGVTGYNVYWFDGWFSSRLVATVTGTSYTAPMYATRNVYYIRARDAANNVSIASNTVTVETTSPTSPPPSSSPPPPPPACKVSYTNTAQWDRGFVASLTVTNTGTVPVDGWTVAFTYGGDQRILSAWNAVHTQDGPAVTLRNAHWNGSLAPGASRTVGLQGTWTASAPAPAAFTLNGLPCTTG
ncbi:cellulose binding domain-containing protein [Actinoplanes sp. NPDC051861]|uniref:cellulose binding domain-containing protein n=1 Tax=Actinoplanes sp. NPDC051861 TaxID=3155170 RepID=UPI0034151CD8